MYIIWFILLGLLAGNMVNVYNNFESLRKSKFKNYFEFTYKKHESVFINIIVTVVFTILYIKFKFNLGYIAMTILVWILITASVRDIKTRKIPNNIIIFGLAVASTLLLINIKDSTYMFNTGLGFVVPLVVLGAISYISKGSLGMGDVKLFAVAGAIAGLPLIMSSLFLSSIMAFIAGIIILFIKKGTKKTEFAFAPFISAGMILTIFIT